MSDWIPVSERLPEVSERVLVSKDDNTYIGTLHELDDDLNWTLEDDTFIHIIYPSDSVVAWMPLPLYKAESEDKDEDCNQRTI